MKKFRFLLMWSLLLMAALRLRTGFADAYYVVEINTGNVENMDESDIRQMEITVETGNGEKVLCPTLYGNNGQMLYVKDAAYNRMLKMGLSTEGYDYLPVSTVHGGISNTTIYAVLFTTENGIVKLATQHTGIDIQSVNSISFNITDSKKRIEVHSIQIYDMGELDSKNLIKANKEIIGADFSLDRLGYVSNQPMLSFEGSRIAYLNFTNGQQHSYDFSEDSAKYRSVTFSKMVPSVSTERVLPSGGPGSYVSIANETQDYKTEISYYFLELQFADVLNAGIESINFGGTKLRDFQEALQLNVKYMDTHGGIHEICIPAITAAVTYAAERGYFPSNDAGGNELMMIYELAQQGGNLVVPLFLSDFACFVGNPTISILGQNAPCAINSVHRDALNKAAGKVANETVLISGAILYKANDWDQMYVCGYNNCTMDYSDISYVAAESMVAELAFRDASNPIKVTAKARGALTMTAATGIYDDFRPTYRSGQYLVEIKTADLSEAGTKDEAYVEITYLDGTGREVSTGKIKLSDVIQEYNGYVGENKEHERYLMQVAKGGVIRFFLKADDVQGFTSATFSIDGKDTWIVEEFDIHYVESATGPIYLRAYKKPFSATTKIEIATYRKINGSIPLYSLKNTYDELADSTLWEFKQYLVLLGESKNRLVNVGAQENTGGESSAGIYIDSPKTVNFMSKEISGITDDEQYRSYYSLSYTDACLTKNFVDYVYQYNVMVKVASNVYNASGDDDSGSTNFFYFKLVFENGESAYVQANQQLTGDAFRANQEARFTIDLNHNYGDLKSIKIIPENDVNKGNPYDKLNIEYIEVDRADAEGHVKTWTFTGSDGSGIGWVGIDYSDAEQLTHKEAEIAKVCGTSSYGVGINLMFVVTTDQNGGALGTTGTVLADVVYRKASTGKTETFTVDVIKAIRDFNNDLGYKEGEIGVAGNGGQFRGGHSDRFLVPVTDIDRIEAISFYGFSDDNEEIPISAVSIYVVNRGSITTDRTVNYDGEFIIQNCKKTCVASIGPGDYEEGDNILRLGPYKETLKRGVTFQFKNGVANIMGSNDTKSTIYTVTEVPIEGLDTVNVVVNTTYVYECSGMPVQAQLEYKTIAGTTLQATTTLVYLGKDSNKNAIFGRYGIPLTGFATLKKITIQGNNSKEIGVSSIGVQHFRANTRMGTYRAIFDTNGTINNGIICKSFEKNVNKGSYQKIYIEMDESMEETVLVAKDYDIAVSLGVKGGAGNGYVYDSSYTFATGDASSLKVLPGGIIEITTKEADVEELNYLNIAATGNLSIAVKRIAVGVYNDTGCIKWYSYEGDYGPTVITNGTEKIFFTGFDKSGTDTVNVLDFTFETMDASIKFGDVGTDSAIGMEITYWHEGHRNNRTLFIPDLNANLVEGSFEQGATARVRILAKGIDSANIKSVRLIPYDAATVKNPDSVQSIYNTTASVSNLLWGLKSICIDFGDGDKNAKKRITVPVQKIIYARREPEAILLSNVYMEAIVNYVDPTTGVAADEEIVINGELEINVPYTEEGVDFTVEVGLFDSAAGWTVTQKDTTVCGDITITPQNTGDGTALINNIYTIHLNGNVEKVTKKEVKFTSVDDDTRSVSITFVMNNYVDENGNIPMKVTASNDRGEIQIGYTGQTMNYTLGTDASKLGFVCTSTQDIKPVITVSKVSGDDVTYTVKDSHDGKLEMEFGARGATDTVYNVVMSYTIGDKPYNFLCNVTVKGNEKATVAKANGAFEFSCKDGNTDIYGVVVGGREDYITLPNKEGLEITYKLNGATGTLEDVTEYHDTEVPVETEPATEPVTEAPSTESPAETEPATEPVTEPSTEPVTEATSTEENASTTEEGTDAQAITEAEGGEGQLQSDSSSSAGATIIPDPDRAVITGSTITLPSGTKTYVFNYNGLFEIRRDK